MNAVHRMRLRALRASHSTPEAGPPGEYPTAAFVQRVAHSRAREHVPVGDIGLPLGAEQAQWESMGPTRSGHGSRVGARHYPVAMG